MTLLSALDLGWTHLKQSHVELDCVPVPGDNVTHGMIVLSDPRAPSAPPRFLCFVLIMWVPLSCSIPTPRSTRVLQGVGCLLDMLTLPALRHLNINNSHIYPSGATIQDACGALAVSARDTQRPSSWWAVVDFHILQPVSTSRCSNGLVMGSLEVLIRQPLDDCHQDPCKTCAERLGISVLSSLVPRTISLQ